MAKLLRRLVLDQVPHTVGTIVLVTGLLAVAAFAQGHHPILATYSAAGLALGEYLVGLLHGRLGRAARRHSPYHSATHSSEEVA